MPVFQDEGSYLHYLVSLETLRHSDRIWYSPFINRPTSTLCKWRDLKDNGWFTRVLHDEKLKLKISAIKKMTDHRVIAASLQISNFVIPILRWWNKITVDLSVQNFMVMVQIGIFLFIIEYNNVADAIFCLNDDWGKFHCDWYIYIWLLTFL